MQATQKTPLSRLRLLRLLLVGLVTVALALVAPATASAAAPAAPNGPAVVATFNVTAFTSWGQNVHVVGNTPELGSWNPDKAMPLSAADYPRWSGSVVLPADKPLEFEYIIKAHGVPVVWEQGPNRTTTTPPTGTYVTHDSFRY